MKLSASLENGYNEINRPKHYASHPSGIECIQIAEHMTFCLGNAIKYIWRAGLKTEDPIKDLNKAIWYLNREVLRLEMEKYAEEANQETQQQDDSLQTQPSDISPDYRFCPKNV